MFHVFGFYKFKRLTGLKKIKKSFQEILINNRVRGTIIFSKEGINGTISGKKNNIEKVKNSLKKVCKIKTFDSENNSIEPEKWNSLLKNKDIKIIDARKTFEFEVGTFKGAENPKVDNFRDFPKYLKKFNKKNTIAMFCTGGIRCEKASVYLKRKGFKNVFQLKGGILNYLKKIKKKNSIWKGECYVFDNRVSLKHKLKVGTYSMCSGCRKPVSTIEKKSKNYVEGISCPKCHDYLTHSQKKRFSMRQNQILTAKKMGKKHIFVKEFY